MFLGRPHPTEGGIGYHNREIGVAGTEGLITVEGNLPFGVIDIHYSNSHNSTCIKTETKGSVPDKFNQKGNIGIFMDFAECIRNHEKPFASGEIGREALAVSLAAKKSAIEKRLVEMREIYNND
jgi:predicted dehydrogenase